ncbi:SAM-dependent methyltransferase [Actinocrinis puniceicyclus]|uniref:SAM-dependent methyltransferase n=1 Tax=Actinocrinis puniceicyclus TaxID=977794 RepID=A0A8J7WN55_9ACTN|nr:SAM-dependent methyltransferase [Actinocrinis puniceicyclus]MBS2963800.1 SAM-dependent methyltransferase [Actinocrinis puniceicyclus]
MDSSDGLPALSPADIERPSPARIYDYWLGGSNNFAADREVAERAAAAMPTLRAAIWANRAFLRRVVKALVTEYGVTQFLDLGSGVPTVGNVHEIAQDADPSCRIVYVDIDPVAVAHGHALLTGNEQAVVIHGDLRHPATVLEHPKTRRLLDFSRPVGVLMNAVLHFMPDEEQPEQIVHAYRDALCPGSFLALSHAAPDLDHPTEQAGMVDDYQRSTRVRFIHRTPEQLAGWLDGFTLEPPGIVQVNEWRPDVESHQHILRTYGLLARKD